MAEGDLSASVHTTNLPTYPSDFFPMLDATALTRFAREPSDEYNPVKTLVGVAFKHQQPIARSEVHGIIQDVGKQIEPAPEEDDGITPQMASFLRRAMGEGVYPYRIAREDAWTITAEAISARRLLLGSDMAGMLLYFAGVEKKVVHSSLSLIEEYVTGVTTHILRKIHREPDTVATLAERVRPMLGPLRLWPLSPDMVTPDNLRRVMEGIFEGTLIGPESSANTGKASIERQVAVLDALSARYLERPSGTKNSLRDPHRAIEVLRRRCTETLGALAGKYGVEKKAASRILKRTRRSLRESLTEQDVTLIKHFLEGSEPTLALPPLPLHIYGTPPSEQAKKLPRM